MLERWLPVVGWEGLYEVSDQGRVMLVGRFRDDGRYYATRLKATSIQNGYPCVSFYRSKQGKRAYVHRLVAEAFLGPCPPEREVNHKDGDKTNPAASNLEWTTRSENQLHAVNHGLRPRRTSGAFRPGNVPWNAGKKTGQTPWNKGCYLCEHDLLPPADGD